MAAALAPVDNHRKRKLEAADDRPVTARCGNCNQRFDLNENGEGACTKIPHDGECSSLVDAWMSMG